PVTQARRYDPLFVTVAVTLANPAPPTDVVPTASAGAESATPVPAIATAMAPAASRLFMCYSLWAKLAPSPTTPDHSALRVVRSSALEPSYLLDTGRRVVCDECPIRRVVSRRGSSHA